MTARWRAAHPDVEPASRLLARIRAEKGRLVAAKRLRLEKPLSPIPESEIPFDIPEGWEWCRLGSIGLPGGGPLNTASLPVDYEMEGVILGPPIPGQSMRVFRFARNGVEVPELFVTSEIIRVIVVTQNSVYRVERSVPRQNSSAG